MLPQRSVRQRTQTVFSDSFNDLELAQTRTLHLKVFADRRSSLHMTDLAADDQEEDEGLDETDFVE